MLFINETEENKIKISRQIKSRVLRSSDAIINVIHNIPTAAIPTRQNPDGQNLDNPISRHGQNPDKPKSRQGYPDRPKSRQHAWDRINLFLFVVNLQQ